MKQELKGVGGIVILMSALNGNVRMHLMNIKLWLNVNHLKKSAHQH
jgi:hypothetical protein